MCWFSCPDYELNEHGRFKSERQSQKSPDTVMAKSPGESLLKAERNKETFAKCMDEWSLLTRG